MRFFLGKLLEALIAGRVKQPQPGKVPKAAHLLWRCGQQQQAPGLVSKQFDNEIVCTWFFLCVMKMMGLIHNDEIPVSGQRLLKPPGVVKQAK